MSKLSIRLEKLEATMKSDTLGPEIIYLSSARRVGDQVVSSRDAALLLNCSVGSISRRKDEREESFIDRVERILSEKRRPRR